VDKTRAEMKSKFFLFCAAKGETDDVETWEEFCLDIYKQNVLLKLENKTLREVLEKKQYRR